MALSTMELAALGAMSAGCVVAIFNKGITDGARNTAARVAWALIGAAIGYYVYRATLGLLYSLDAGVVAASSSRGGHVTFDRSEHPLLYWVTFAGLTMATGVIASMSLMALWKAVKRD